MRLLRMSWLVAVPTALVAAWLLVQDRLPEPEPRLRRYLPHGADDVPAMVRSAHVLWNATPDHHDSEEVLRFIHVLAERLNDDAWRAVSAPVHFALNQHGQAVGVQELATKVLTAVLPRTVRAGSTEELIALVDLANSNKPLSTRVNGYLDLAMNRPDAPGRFEDAWQGRVVAACIRAGDHHRAIRYLSRLPEWSAAPGSQGWAWREAAEACRNASGGSVEIARVIRAWQACNDSPLGRSCVQPSLEDCVLNLVGRTRATQDLPSAVELFVRSGGEPGAEKFWHRILFRACPAVVKDQSRAAETAAIVRGFTAEWGRPDVEYEFWMRAGELAWRWSSNLPDKAVPFYERAIRASQTDAERVQAVRSTVFQLRRIPDADRALALASAAVKDVSDPVHRKELDSLVQDLTKERDKAAPEAKAPPRKDPGDARDLSERTKDLLTRLLAEKGPEREVRILKEILRHLEREILK